ncbi:MAG: hypothetical protein M1819_000778 [Sarea resinae]|nr:MAG: hypothetical protein M1819_000778 [Sarea resinae]
MSVSTSDSRPPLERRSTTEGAEDRYFVVNPQPKALSAHRSQAEAFINHHQSGGRRVVLVTSGGTTVPLENQTVRFIDNFSAGTRGATSAEYFLEAGYAVIFLHRQFSLLPYSRHYSHSTNCFLDFMRESDDGAVIANEKYQSEMRAVLRKYTKAKRENTLLLLPFTTITDYLWELKTIAMLMQPLGAKGIFYLAAAVSDFFVPKDKMVEHKIQSSEEGNQMQKDSANSGLSNGSRAAAVHVEGKKLTVDLDPVPKFLKRLVTSWAPEGMIVSFKLETDPSMLIGKAQQALDRYSHHLVIGNLLSTRKWEVVFVAPDTPARWIRVPSQRRTKSMSGQEQQAGNVGQSNGDVGGAEGLETDIEIESLIVPEVEKMHTKHMSKSES